MGEIRSQRLPLRNIFCVKNEQKFSKTNHFFSQSLFMVLWTKTAILPINYIILSNKQDDRGACNTNLMNCNVISFIDYRLLLLLLLCYVYKYVRMHVFKYKEQSCSTSGDKISPPLSVSLSQPHQFCRFLKFQVSLVSSETDAWSPQGRSDTHKLSPPQRATGNKTEKFT